MRLIDADALKEDLDTVNPVYERMIFWFKRIIDAQPTVDIRIPIQVIEHRGDNKDGNKSDN